MEPIGARPRSKKTSVDRTAGSSVDSGIVEAPPATVRLGALLTTSLLGYVRLLVHVAMRLYV